MCPLGTCRTPEMNSIQFNSADFDYYYLLMMKVSFSGDEHSSLRTWYESHPQHPSETCDFSQVRCIKLAMTASPHYSFVMRNEDPYDVSIYLFYKARPVIGLLEICGLITWTNLFRLNGQVNLQTDLTNNPVCIAPYLEERCEKVDDDNWFWIPVHFPRQQQPFGVGSTREAMHKRLDWYLMNTPIGRKRMPFNFFE